ncbi:MAG TPA: 30S ribosomal protein S18 [Candidatus Kapabacteria bacterium]|jgi:small subunit ribosomal protein S18|nr:30S ribosomal protein S18 [Ignavibacteria bacterium]HRK58599.1 30S ribosomal protein S18 [Candidatus Kapabacteria bacterium]
MRPTDSRQNPRQSVNNPFASGLRKQRTAPKKKNNPLGDNRTIDYLDAKSLFRFTNDQGKILPRRITGVSAYQQRQVCDAIKYARHLALIPFVNHDTK